MQPSPRTVQHLRDLIAFDSVSRNSNLDLIDWAGDLLRAAGATTRLVFNAERSKANLFATFPGSETDQGGLVLSGHSDVVAVDGQDWLSDPFRAVIRGEKLYGRGACDMKGFIAVALARAPALAEAGLRKPLHVALSYDEEQGCLGISSLLDDIAAAGIRPSCCIVGEPTSMRLVGAHKGGAVYRCQVCGLAAHSSLAPHAVNAIEYAGRMISFIQGMADDFAREGPFDADFDVPHTTISCNLIQGGSGGNIVPAECSFVFEYRYLPGTDEAAILARIEDYAATQLLPRMRAVDAGAGITLTNLARIPALRATPGEEVFTAACVELATNGAGKVAYGTEASFFQASGIPTIVCGPGSIEQAHKADEYVALSQLAACDRFIEGLIARLSV